MKMNKQPPLIKYGRHYGLEIQDICAQLGYFYVFPCNTRAINLPENESINSIILTYKDDDIEMKQLMADFKSKLPQFQNKKYLRFSLSNGYLIDEQKQVVWLKKFLGRKRIDGLVLFLNQDEERRLKDQQKKSGKKNDQVQDTYIDECALTEYLGIKDALKTYNMHINFAIPSTKYILTFRVENQQKLQNLLNKFYKQVYRVFKVQLDNDLVTEMFTLKKGQKVQVRKEMQKSIISFEKLTNNSTVYISLKHKIQFKRIVTYPNKRIIIYKENSNEFIEEYFQEVEFMTFKTLYMSKLQGNKTSKHEMRCLKVMDTLVKENENLSKLDIFFAGSQHEILRIVGKVVSQKMYFYKQMGETIGKVQNFKIQSIIYPPDKNTKEDKFRYTIRSEIEQRAKLAQDQHFQDGKNVEPIFIYTCEKTHNYYVDQDGMKKEESEPIYAIVNRYLRDFNFLDLNLEDLFKDWRSLYTSSLIKQLQKVKCKKQYKTVYRGINFDLNTKKGQILTFKSFTSTSTKKQTAYDFLLKPKDNVGKHTMQTSKQYLTLLQMKIFSGKPIKLMAKYSEEQEILSMPYTQFKVLSIQKTKINGKQVNYIQMEELSQELSSSKYPKTQANFIIWVDDNLKEGKDIYHYIKKFDQPTLLIQLESTEALANWLQQQKNAKILLDKTANFVFITDMTREKNGLAGIEGIIELQKYTKQRQMPIFMYVGNKQVALQKLNDHKHKIRRVEKIEVGEKYEQIKNFLKKYINVAFQVQPLAKQQSKSICELM